MPHKKPPSIKIGVNFTKGQIGMIDAFVSKDKLGASRAEVIKQIVLFYIYDKDKEKESIFS